MSQPKTQRLYSNEFFFAPNQNAKTPTRTCATKLPFRTMKIAVEGCCHGELNRIYDTLRDAERSEGFKIDLLICCGDFQVQFTVSSFSVVRSTREARRALVWFIGGRFFFSSELFFLLLTF